MSKDSSHGCFWAVVFIAVMIIIGISCAAMVNSGQGGGVEIDIDRNKPRPTLKAPKYKNKPPSFNGSRRR